MVTLTSMRGPIPADASVLGQPAFGRGAGSWAAGLWTEPDLGTEDHAAERCRIREMRSQSHRDTSCWLLSQLPVDELGFFPIAVQGVRGSRRINTLAKAGISPSFSNSSHVPAQLHP